MQHSSSRSIALWNAVFEWHIGSGSCSGEALLQGEQANELYSLAMQCMSLLRGN
jgi:hypothetical protein